MNIDIADLGGVLTLSVRGDIDLATAPLLDKRLSAAEASAAELLVVDLDQVRFIDSSGLHVLLKHVSVSSQNGDRLRLTRGSAQVRRLFEVAGISERLPYVATDLG